VFHDKELFVIGTNIKTNKNNSLSKPDKKLKNSIYTAKMIRLAPSPKKDLYLT